MSSEWKQRPIYLGIIFRLGCMAVQFPAYGHAGSALDSKDASAPGDESPPLHCAAKKACPNAWA